MALFKKGKNWYIDYWPQGRGGQRRREMVGHSKSLAKQVLEKRIAEAREYKFFPSRKSRRLSFKEFSARFWELHGRNFESNSWRYMLGHINKHFGNRLLNDITIADVQAFYNQRAKETSGANANRYVTLLSILFNKAIEWGDYHQKNPAFGIKDERAENKRTRYLTLEELERLQTACSERISPMIQCLVFTGMRRGELLSLRWENVDLENGFIHLWKTKSGEARSVPIASKLRDILEALEPKKEGKVFEPSLATLRRDYAAALEAAGLRDDVTMHTLRHTFASHFVMNTGDLYALQKIVGHSTPAMSQRYAHLAKNFLRSEMEVFNAKIPARKPFNPAAMTQKSGVRVDTLVDTAQMMGRKQVSKNVGNC